MFGNGWQGPGNPPRYFPPTQNRPPSLVNNLFPPVLPRGNIIGQQIPTTETQWIPLPSIPPLMPVFTADGTVLNTRPHRPGFKNYNSFSRIRRANYTYKDDRKATRPDVINDDEFTKIQETVRMKLTPEMIEKARSEKASMPEPLMSGEYIELEPNWNPYERLDLSQTTYPKKVVHNLIETLNRTTDSEYIVQTSTKIVRNPNSTITDSTRSIKTKWRRTEVIDNGRDNSVPNDMINAITLSSDSDPESSKDTPDSPEPNRVIIHLTDSTEESEPSSYGRSSDIVILFENEPNTSNAPEKATTSKSLAVDKDKLSPRNKRIVYDRSQTSLRYINGKRITGDSKECYAHLNGKCNAGFLCKYEHDGSMKHTKFKICQRLLRGLCRPDNKDCRCEHATLLPHQYPQCVFFLRGECTLGDKCTLLHTKYSKELPNCEEFLRGTCLNGDQCDFPHSYPFHFAREHGMIDESRKLPVPVIPTNDGVFQWFED